MDQALHVNAELGTCFSGGLGNARLMVGSDDLKGLFQPQQFLILWSFQLKASAHGSNAVNRY